MAKRLQGKDFEKAEGFVTDELQSRKNSDFRKDHERVWKEVDRQVAMKPMSRTARGRDAKKDWRAALELGELAKASEILSDDVRRLAFPRNRTWFEPHSEIDWPLNQQTGEPEEDPFIQSRIDNGLQALMAQQHIDFGLKDRVGLSVKEALHHGSYVVEARWESATKIHDGTGVEAVSAPVWVPHSMWHCYPDPSPSIQGTNMFYPGSMVVESKIPRNQLKRLKGLPGYYPSRIDKVPKKGPKDDIELITLFGTLVIGRSGNDLIRPNSKTILANGQLIYHRDNPLPFPEIIYSGWEKLDVRDPYYVSPLIKMSPTQKMGSQLASRLMDNIDLKVEPPLIYSTQDPEFAMNGGPTIAPGAKSGTKGKAEWKTYDAGDPNAALSGLEFIVSEIHGGTGVDNRRSGQSDTVRQTAFEIQKLEQGGERRAVDFVDKLELHGLRPFLVMQHELNKRNLRDYAFYNPSHEAPDFERVGQQDLPRNANFEIVGSRSVLGEEKRQQNLIQGAQIIAQIPHLAETQNWEQIGLQIWEDMGVKDPSKFVTPSADAERVRAQAEEVIAQLEEQMQQLASEIQRREFDEQEHDLEIAQEQLQTEQRDLRIEQLQTTINALRQSLKLESKRGSSQGTS